jgi:hypothetical protein
MLQVLADAYRAGTYTKNYDAAPYGLYGDGWWFTFALAFCLATLVRASTTILKGVPSGSHLLVPYNVTFSFRPYPHGR